MNLQDLNLYKRNFVDNIGLSILNIFSLAVGLASVFIILLFILNEITYDSQYKHKNRIFRIISCDHVFQQKSALAPYPMVEALKRDFSQIDKVAGSFLINDFKVKKGVEFINETNLQCVDFELLEILDISVESGSAIKALSHPGNIMISKSMTKKYFGYKNPIGQKIDFFINDSMYQFVVGAVFMDIPVNSSFQANFIVNNNVGIKIKKEEIYFFSDSNFTTKQLITSWKLNFTHIYFKIKDNAKIDDIFIPGKKVCEKYMPSDSEIEYLYQNIKDIHLHSESITNDEAKHGSLKQIKIFSLIAFFILALISLNYIILSIAKSARRIKEIGIRKIVGATRRDIVKLILFESVSLSLLAFPISFLVITLCIPYINSYLNLNLQFNITQNVPFIFISLSITILIGILSGSYIAFFLSSLNPATILNQRKLKYLSSVSVKKGIMVMQFAIFIFLLFATIIINKQFNLLYSKPLGFEKENLLIINLNDKNVRQNYLNIKNDLLKNPNITHVSGAMICPPSNSKMTFNLPANNKSNNKIVLNLNFVDYDFCEAYGFKLMDGRFFSKDFSTDVDAVILSEKAVKELHLDEPINSKIGLGMVIGVISDMHSHSMHEEVKPVAILLDRDYIMNLVIKLDGNNNENAINYIEKIWEHYAMIEPFAYNTLDEQISMLYPEERMLKTVVSSFTLLSILLAVFGLFATSLLIAEQKTKEIGIRKVLGSSNWQIIYRFITEFITLCIISLIIAIPAGYYIMHNWLNSFAYKVAVTCTDYFISIITSIVIIVFTLLYVSTKLFRLNPLEIIKQE